jgi:tetratricopeptide (TPR) repeat protein
MRALTDASPLNPRILSEIQLSLSLARRGDFASARSQAEATLLRGNNRDVVEGVLGMLCCQAGDTGQGIVHLKSAHAARPDDLGVASNLAMALMETGATAAALAVCSADMAKRDTSLRLLRLRAFLLQASEDFAAAALAYADVVAAAPDDFESWNNLGNARAATGDIEGSIAAIERAISLRPDVSPLRLNLATTLLDAGRLDDAIAILVRSTADDPADGKAWHDLSAMYKQAGRDDDALLALERAAALELSNPDLQVQLGMERVGTWNMAGAEEAFQKAVAIDPQHPEAYSLLALMYEHTNRDGEFPKLLAKIEKLGVETGTVAFIRALSLRREGRFAEGLAVLAAKPDSVEPVRSAQLAGQFHDRLGNAAESFAAFVEMNRLQRLDVSDPVNRAAQYRDRLARDRAIITQQWFDGWQGEGPVYAGRTPTFLIGFPRSGTTLLDTLLMGHSTVEVLEERPLITAVERELGSIERLSALDATELAHLRSVYFQEAKIWTDLREGSVLVDKNPLHLNKIPIIHRLFPHARIILALRHPCDAVLSCYTTNFRLNNAMANFTDLDSAAEVYDQSFGFWEQCRALMPLNAHEIRYEDVVADKEATLRPLFDFLGLDWRDEALDHRQTAIDRGVISTASYAQVMEPIYSRSSGRWTRYRDNLQPVIPVLAPWARRYGYAV